MGLDLLTILRFEVVLNNSLLRYFGGLTITTEPIWLIF